MTDTVLGGVEGQSDVAHAELVDDPRTAGLVTTREEGRVVYSRLSDGFPEPLRQHCLRSLVELFRRVEQQG